MAIRRFEDLEVWQVARELVRGVFQACENQPLARDFAMAYQMKRAAISIPSNIAEGFERGSRKQQIEARYTAKGSAGELRCQTLLAQDSAPLDDETHNQLLAQRERCSRMLAAYIHHLQETRDKFPGLKLAANGASKNTSSPRNHQ